MDTTNRKIEEFLDKELPKTESDAFRQELDNNETLAQEVQFIKEVNESITDDEVYYLRQKLNLLINQQSNKIPFIKIASGIAAGIVIIFSILTITKGPNPLEAYDQFYSPYVSDLSTRSAENKITGLQFGIKLYEEGDYETAVNILENYNNENFDSPAGKYYLGLSALAASQHHIAQKCFEELINSENYSYSLHAKWYLGMLYLKKGQTELAKPLFEELSNTDNYYSARAKKILKRHI